MRTEMTDPRRACALVLLAAAVALSGPAVGQAIKGDKVAGQGIWNGVCTNCHQPIGAASSASIALSASYSPSVIRNAINNVLEMKNASAVKALTDTDLTNVAAYFGSVINAKTPNYEGLWWASPGGSEAGWGINIAHQYNVVFLSWFTYDATGRAWWMVMTASPVAGQTPVSYQGAIYSGHGPAFSASPFPPLGSAGGAVAQQVGTGTLTFADISNGSFTYTVNGTTQTKAITRELFGPQPACVFVATPDYAQVSNYQDIWWADPPGSEAGWGMNLTHEGDQIFATWYTFALDGAPMWLVSTAAKAADKKYVGELYQLTSGPAFSATPFPPLGSPGGPAGGVVGSLTLTFADGNHGSFAYTVNGVAQTKVITRQIFASPPTVCQ